MVLGAEELKGPTPEATRVSVLGTRVEVLPMVGGELLPKGRTEGGSIHASSVAKLRQSSHGWEAALRRHFKCCVHRRPTSDPLSRHRWYSNLQPNLQTPYFTQFQFIPTTLFLIQ
ncbi:hypothetical protein L1049_001865 [Liquidambar formosana]|uniref:Uncharacterized protein n=1 Tax=Liquidambar formosana TaxID=63359 RepID=A0AAP0NG39_LIQFO